MNKPQSEPLFELYKGVPTSSSKILRTPVSVIFGSTEPHARIKIYPSFISPDSNVDKMTWMEPLRLNRGWDSFADEVGQSVTDQRRQRNAPGFAFYYPNKDWHGGPFEHSDGWIVRPVVGDTEHANSANLLHEGMFNALVFAQAMGSVRVLVVVPQNLMAGGKVGLDRAKAMLCAVAHYSQMRCYAYARPVTFYFDEKLHKLADISRFAQILRDGKFGYNGQNDNPIKARLCTVDNG